MSKSKAKEQAVEKAAFIEEYLDGCVRKGKAPDADRLKFAAEFRKLSLTRYQAKTLKAHYQGVLDGYESDYALWGRERNGDEDEVWDQTREFYAGWDEERFEKEINFYSKLVQSLEVFAAPAPKKQKPQQEQAEKFKHGTKDQAVGLVGREPYVVLKAAEIYVWNTKTRKLGVYVAETKKGLCFRDGMISGYDIEKSLQKMAKPADMRGKRDWRKVLDGLPGMATRLDGKGSEHVLIL